MRITGWLLMGGLLLPAAGWAQDAPPRPAGAEQVTDAELALAHDLIVALRTEETMRAGAEVMLTIQAQQNAEMARVLPAMREWVRSIYSKQEAMDAFARIYAEHFTEAELSGLVAFFQSPLGRRYASELGSLATAGGLMGARLAQENQADLVEQIQKVLGEQDN